VGESPSAANPPSDAGGGAECFIVMDG
jgi:hypothetical protein